MLFQEMQFMKWKFVLTLTVFFELFEIVILANFHDKY